MRFYLPALFFCWCFWMCCAQDYESTKLIAIAPYQKSNTKGSLGHVNFLQAFQIYSDSVWREIANVNPQNLNTKMHCNSKKLSTENEALGWFLTGGTLLSFVPQWLRIIFRRSSFGISIFNQVIFVIQSACSFATVLVGQFSIFECCATLWDSETCSKNLIAPLQLGMSIFSLLIGWTLYIIYFDLVGNAEDQKAEHTENWGEGWVTYPRALMVYFSSILFITFVYGLGFLLRYEDHHALGIYIDILGGISAIGMASGTIPQIVRTFQIKTDGAVSIITIILQAPGTGLVCYFLMVDNISKVATWGPFGIGFILQSSLLVELIYYRFIFPKLHSDSTILVRKSVPDSDEEYLINAGRSLFSAESEVGSEDFDEEE